MKVKTEKERIDLGRWSKYELEHIMNTAPHFSSPGERIGFISQHFLNTPYQESTLTGSIDEQEIFVMNLGGVDCFTFIDYVEAMRLSGSFDEFKENLKKVRYQSGDVDYRKRNHFFTDWAEFSKANICDATGEIGGDRTKKAKKILNIKEDGTCFLQGIAPRERKILYIPTHEMNPSALAAIKTGDYAGIYSELPGLDVSHTGIIIKADNDECFLRHASSLEQYRKVVDQPLVAYMADKTGLIVLRALEPARHIMI
ncbi:MAG: DUF1460 domain-containing protein [Proteobacteria bacterium]|nr:DUF1460 domain-containing protein [Pseudomonadota bacterium]